MDTVYYTSGSLMTIIMVVLLVATVVLLIKPHLINQRKIIKHPLSRGKIVMIALLALTITTIGFGSVMAATEPDAVKQDRLRREAATQAAQEAKQPVVKTETAVEPIPFESTTQETALLPKGETRKLVEGINGETTITYTVTYINGAVSEKLETGRIVTKEPVTEVIEIGTYVAPVSAPVQSRSSSQGQNCNPNYTGCVPNVSYDLNCKDVGYSVRVIGYDQYNLDGDGDGYGCESY